MKNATIALSLILCGCAGSDLQRSVLQMNGQFSVEPSQSPDFDYLVKVGNVGDIGYNPDDYATRERVALAALKTQCTHAAVVGESVITHGTIPIQGVPAKTYFMRVKCK